MRCFTSSATAMFTPASAYFIEGDSLSFFVRTQIPVRRAFCGMTCNQPRRARDEILRQTARKPAKEGALKSKLQNKTSGSKRPEQPFPSHSTGMDDGIRIGSKSF